MDGRDAIAYRACLEKDRPMNSAFPSGGQGPSVGTNHRRRAVFTALTEVFSTPDRVNVLFKFCEEFCNSEPKFLVNRFLMRAEQRGMVSERDRQALARGLYLSLAKPYDALARYPSHLVEEESGEEAALPANEAGAFADFAAARPPAPAARPTPPPKFEPKAGHKVFQTVLAHVANRLYYAYGRRPARIGLALAGATAQAQAETHTLSMLIDWIDGDLEEDAIPDNLPLDEMRTALRVLYLASCNLCGRDSAAQALAQGMRLANALREAQTFPPKLLV
jgi:hypothetical protein